MTHVSTRIVYLGRGKYLYFSFDFQQQVSNQKYYADWDIFTDLLLQIKRQYYLKKHVNDSFASNQTIILQACYKSPLPWLDTLDITLGKT